MWRECWRNAGGWLAERWRFRGRLFRFNRCRAGGFLVKRWRFPGGGLAEVRRGHRLLRIVPVVGAEECPGLPLGPAPPVGELGATREPLTASAIGPHPEAMLRLEVPQVLACVVLLQWAEPTQALQTARPAGRVGGVPAAHAARSRCALRAIAIKTSRNSGGVALAAFLPSVGLARSNHPTWWVPGVLDQLRSAGASGPT